MVNVGGERGGGDGGGGDGAPGGVGTAAALDLPDGVALAHTVRVQP